MKATVHCQDCQSHIGTFERDGVIDGSEIELSREYVICFSCGSGAKVVEVFDTTIVEPEPEAPPELPQEEPSEETPQEEPPASQPKKSIFSFFKFW